MSGEQSKPDAARRVSNYGEGDDLFQVLLELIRSASERVWIKVPWWDTSPAARELAEAIIAAKKRGVDVLVLCRPESSNDAILRDLRRAGIKLAGVRFIHEKELLADASAVVHSMNFTSKEIERNQNSGFLHRDSTLVEALEAGFTTLIDNQKASAVGDEGWTRTDKLIPPELRKYLDRHENLNPLQSRAVPTTLSTAGHVMVVAPTSSGKTLIGQVAALRSIVSEGKPAVWLLPARALAAEVAATARRWNEHGIRSVELTGETNMSSDTVRKAQLWVATTEKFEALYRRSSLREFMATIGCLIIDEVHLVGDHQRGATLESLIARLRAAEGRTRIVALSATVSNAQELANWFNAELVMSAWRPTILTTQLVPYDPPPPGSKREEYEAAKDQVALPLLRDLLGGSPNESSVLEASPTSDPPSALVFCGSKNGVRRVAGRLAGQAFRDRHDEDLVEACYSRGVGIHFRGGHRVDRALTAFKERQIRALVATSGLSTGVNTPARFVLIRDLDLGMTPIEVSQVQQMFGRAGRAGQEPEGFGFMLVPRDEESSWRVRLADGYAAQSQVGNSLADALLAEMLIGSIRDREGAHSWFKETFAFAQETEGADIDDALDHLVLRGFATEDAEDGLTITEIGALTSRLMVEVESASELLVALAELPIPGDSAEAEELVLQIVTTSVEAFREWPVNERTYDDIVSTLLFTWTPRVTSRMGSDFGPRFCMAAAQMALRDPQKLRARRPPPGVSIGDFKRAIDDMPRYLAWIAALGYVETTIWAPAVASELSRRLTWWHLSPHPERGSGRLLWMLERLLEPENRRSKMQDLWSRARKAGFVAPDRVDARPRDVDISADGFAELLHGRADLRLSPPKGTELALDTGSRTSRLTALSNRGARRAITTSRPTQGRIDLALPPGVSTELAADVFLYTRAGDFAYQNLTLDLPDDDVAALFDPLGEADAALPALREVAMVKERPKPIRRLFQSERKRRLAEILPLLAPDPALRPVALALAEHETEPHRTVTRLRANLDVFLLTEDRHDRRPPSTVLRAGAASPSEFQLTLNALLATLQIEVGMADANGKLVSLVRLDGEWQLTTPTTSDNVRIEPIYPEALPTVVASVRDDPAEPPVRVAPRCAWMNDFIPTA